MQLLTFAIDVLIVLCLLRLLIRPNEAFFQPIYRIIYNITDAVLTPSRYLTKTPVQGILLTTAGLVVLRGIVYMADNTGNEALKGMGILLAGSANPLTGVAVSFLEFFRLLFQAYMVMWVISVASGRRFGTPLIHIIARAFLPIDAALNRFGIPRSRIIVASFFFLWILYALLVTAILSAFILKSIPEPIWFVVSLGDGLKLFIRLFPGFFTIVIIAGVLLSWVNPDPSNPVVQTIYGISEPLLAPFRRFVPLLGGLDISPIFAFLAFQFLGRIAMELVNGVLRAFQ